MVKHNLYTKIFRQLRGYFISPHLNVWRGLRKRLFSSNFPDNTSLLKDFKKEPPPELFEQILETHQQLHSKFSELKDLKQQPGEDQFEKIIALIKKEGRQQPGIIRSIPFYKKISAAAALLIVLISCFFLLKTGKPGNNKIPGFVNNSSPVFQDSIVLKNSDSLNITESKEKLLVNAGIDNTGKSKRRSSFNTANYLSFNNVSVGDTKIPVEDNDLLYSFTKFPYRFGQPNPWNEKKKTVVKINSYSSINVSAFMSSVIADLYKVKENGKPTNKAKKAKLKINRWRKTDIKRFDKKKNKNPLDIIDLGENVF